MSVWRIGSVSGGPGLRPAGDDPKDQVKAVFDRLTVWIPGDVLAFFVAGVTALASKDGAEPSVTFLILMIVLTPVIALASWWATGRDFTSAEWAKAGLATVAFAIWSISVPFSGWQRWSAINQNQAMAAIGAGVAGLVFGYVADGIVARLKRNPPNPGPNPPNQR